MHKKNMLIREKARDLGVYHWEIADDQTRIVSVIDEIANSREVIKHADLHQEGR